MLKLPPAFSQYYAVATIDIGSPKLGNLGWHINTVDNDTEHYGKDLDAFIDIFSTLSKQQAFLLGLEAPLFIPIRADILDATKARKGESPRPWSAGAGAQVLAINLPIMCYLFKQLSSNSTHLEFCIDPKNFAARPGQILIFEALVSGQDKGSSHIMDAKIMNEYCKKFSLQKNPTPEYFTT
jgi:hypothetical protein